MLKAPGGTRGPGADMGWKGDVLGAERPFGGVECMVDVATPPPTRWGEVGSYFAGQHGNGGCDGGRMRQGGVGNRTGSI